jgi:hypothetical protein
MRLGARGTWDDRNPIREAREVRHGPPHARGNALAPRPRARYSGEGREALGTLAAFLTGKREEARRTARRDFGRSLS